MGNASGFCHFLCDLGKLFKVTESQFCHYFVLFIRFYLSLCVPECVSCAPGKAGKGHQIMGTGVTGSCELIDVGACN